MTVPDKKQFDVVILGGGPAGSLLARHLVGRGFHVLLKTLPPSREIPRPLHREGLAPRALDRLQSIGLDNLPLLGAGPMPRAAHWGGQHNRFNSEALIDRTVFDASLLEQARDAGVILETGRVTGPVVAGDFKARLLVEARGRQAPRPKVIHRGPRTVALVKHYRDVRQEMPGTILSSHPFGWIWAALPGDGSATVQLMLDAGSETLSRDQAPRLFQSLIETCPELWGFLQNARAVGSLRARDAGMVLMEELARPDYLRIGDAAAAIDPLAGHGLYEAIGGARAAEAVVATLLDRPDMADAAIHFHQTRIKDLFLRHARMGRDFYRMEQRFLDHPFWARRRDWPDDAPIHAAPLATPARVRRMPASIDGYIEMRDVIVTADHPRGILSISGVPLVPLLALVGSLPDDAVLARHFAVSPDAVRSAKAWLARYGLTAVPVP